MKIFKILTAVLLIAVLSLSLSACGKNGDNGNVTSSADQTASTESAVSGTSSLEEGFEDGESKDQTADSKNETPNENGNENGNGDNTADTSPDPVPDVQGFSLSVKRQGDTVTVSVNIAENPGIAAFKLLLNYDKDLLTPKTIENKAVSVTSNLQQTTKLDGTVTAVYVDAKGTDQNGTLFNVIFDIKDGKTGIAKFTLTADSVLNAAATEITLPILGNELNIK